MKYEISKLYKNKLLQAFKSLTVYSVLFLAFCAVFYSPKTSYSTSLPLCSSLDNAIAADPGVNCLYYGLPICTSTLTATATIANPQHRVNCADLVDTPLCTDVVPTSSALSTKNCALECKNIPDSSDVSHIRGIDYAAHNRDCVRFCDDIETGVPTSESQLASVNKCMVRNCHQAATGYTTDGSGNPQCNLLPCNLLTPNELNDSKFDDDTKKYCEGDNIKCYDFVASQLAHLRVRLNNKMCEIHDCQPTSVNCPDDTVSISNNPEIFNSDTYEAEYVRTVNMGFPLSDSTNSFCNQATCLPIFQRGYECTADGTGDLTVPNVNCDPGSACVSSFCYKAIDCNLAANVSASECLVGDPEVNLEDDTNSWFYRPVPMSKATQGDGKPRPEMAPNFCYTKGDMENLGWGSRSPSIDMGFFTIPSYYSHSYISPDRTISPGHCGARKNGGRGTGYIYLCGNDGILNKMVSDDVGYHKGYIKTEFSEEDATYQVRVCLRFKNSSRPDDFKSDSETCGSRECGVLCAFDHCQDQACGSDVCRTLTVKESEEGGQFCKLDGELFGISGGGRNCATIIDTYLRLRAVKYGNKVCTFLDVRGQTANANPMFLSGSEKVDGICLSGTTNEDGSCNAAKNSNDQKDDSDVWRATKRIHYIDNNRAADQPQGYVDLDGRLFRAKECMQVPLRVPPPKLYNLATVQNSLTLFSPPLYILNSRVFKGGSISVSSDGVEPFGKTDFNYPEIEIRFGTTLQKLSLTIGKTGHELDEDLLDPDSIADISTTVNGSNYDATVFVKKEFDSNNLIPKFCLYRRIVDADEVTRNIQLECVKRIYPDIDNDSPIIRDDERRRFLVSAPTSPVNRYDSSSMVMKYQGKISETTEPITLDNVIHSIPTCDQNTDQYQLCVQRDVCNQLTNECVTNEINIQNAATDAERNAFKTFKNKCDGDLLYSCNLKKGIFNNVPTYSNAYGWFDEMCVVNPPSSSNHPFGTKFKSVVSYKVVDGSGNQMTNIVGKCKISPNSPYMTDGNAATNCDSGGKAPNCLCIEVADDATPGSDEIIRKQTPREAGLCIDIPTPNSCPAINYASHSARTAGTTAGHAEFPTAFGGMGNVEGECKEYWKAQSSLLTPKMSCIRNADDSVNWDYTVSNPCIRYSCPSIYTADPVYSPSTPDGRYQDGYVKADETTDLTRGNGNGNALWNTHLQTSDLVESATAYYCISGFKKNGSTAVKDAAGVITGYSGGTFPTRHCSQLGIWNDAPANSCQRITCPAINPTDPSTLPDPSAARTNAWTAWNNAGGASYPQANASRSATHVPPDSIVSGDCNESLGYFQSSGGNLPSRTCDHLGNWGPVVDACVTRCDAITSSAIASTPNNGYAYWLEAVSSIGSDVAGTFNGCVSGYYKYPYPPTHDAYGAALSNANDLTRAAENPRRMCQVVSVAGGGTANVWTKASPACSNKCPGSATDSRIGVGVTQHLLGDGSTLDINWDDADPGEIQVKAGPVAVSDPSLQTTSNYASNSRTNGYYIVARKCGTDRKWVKYDDNGVESATGTNDVQPKCASTSSEISGTKALFSKVASYVDEYEILTGVCKSGYGSPNPPQYTCEPKDSTRKIDQFYFKKTGGNNACLRVCAAANTIIDGTDFSETSEYVGSTITTAQYDGDTVNLACISGSGYKLGAGTASGTAASLKCGRASAERINSAPVATCKDDGTWAIGNDCNACRSCTSSSQVLGTQFCYSTRRSRNDCYGVTGSCPDGQRKYEFTPTTLTNNDSKSWCQHQTHDGKTSGQIKLTCKDGKYEGIAICRCGIAVGGHNTWLNSDCEEITATSHCM